MVGGRRRRIMLMRLPAFALDGHPLKDGILGALKERNAQALRAALAHGLTNPGLGAVLGALALHFERDLAGRNHCLARPYPDSDWRITAMIVLAACAIEDMDLALALNTLNTAYQQTSTSRAPNRRPLLDLIRAYTFELDRVCKEASPRLVGARKLRRAGPTAYVISYPRSGSTMSLNALCHVFQSKWHSAFPGDGHYFCRELYDPSDTSVLLVKDHVYKSDYFKDRAIYVVRDGRDSMVSLCRFLEPINDWDITDADGFVDFLVAIAERYLFGFWSENVRLAVEAQDAGADIRFWRYEDIVRDPIEYLHMAEHIASDRIVARDPSELAAHIERRRLEIDDPQWGYAVDAPDLFATWSQNRGGSNWRTVFNDRARAVFHELGGTEMLMRFGYETDADWWRKD
jgi:Sulfotransferase domain